MREKCDVLKTPNRGLFAGLANIFKDLCMRLTIQIAGLEIN
jgi:hypothetical protein